MTSTAALVPGHRPGRSAVATAVLGVVLGPVLGIARRIAAVRVRARTVRVLQTLDDNVLADIGLTRERIGRIESEPRYHTRNSGL